MTIATAAATGQPNERAAAGHGPQGGLVKLAAGAMPRKSALVKEP